MKGSIRQRSKGSWEICIDVGRDPATGKRLRHFESVRGNKGAARQRLAQLLVEIEKGGYSRTPRDLTVADYLRSWLHDYVELNCAPKTIESYRTLVDRHIVPEIGSVRLVDLQPRHLQVLYARKKNSGLSNRTVRYIYSLMAETLGHAVKTGIVARNVAKATEPPRIEHKVMPTMKPEDLERFFEVARKTPLYHNLFYLLLHTGLRRGEALALKWKHVDMGLTSLGVAAYLSITQCLNKVNGRLVLREPKTGAGKRRVALSPSLTLVLRQHREEQNARYVLLGRQLTNEDHVFSYPDGSPLDPSTVSHAFKKTLHRAGLPLMPLHSLRHTHATLLLQAGIHPRVVMERLGHSSIRVTLDTYSHVVGGLQEAAAQRLDEFLLAKGGCGENVGKMSAKSIEDTSRTPESNIGVGGFEPPAT
jgi:integrase